MMDTTTRLDFDGPTLLVALEIGTKDWKVATTIGLGQAPRIHTVPAGDFQSLVEELLSAKRRFGLPADVQIVSCYEAGRCGFWPHRALQRIGIRNLVVDSSSIEVNRRQRRAKTDRLDACKLVLMLARYVYGDERVWSLVRVPEPMDEDFRQVQRQIVTLTRERARTINRVKGLLATQGANLGGGSESGTVLGWQRASALAGAALRARGGAEEWAGSAAQTPDARATADGADPAGTDPPAAPPAVEAEGDRTRDGLATRGGVLCVA
jgi:transposase